MKMSLSVFNILTSPDNGFMCWLFFLLKMSPINSCPLAARPACLPWLAPAGL